MTRSPLRAFRTHPGLVVLVLAAVLGPAVGVALVVLGARSDRGHKSDAELKIEQVIEALHLLEDHYVEPVNRTRLLTAAWTGARNAAGVKLPGLLNDQPPTFTGETARDEATFRQSLSDLLSRSKGEVSAGELVEAAITAMAASLDDGHTAFIPPAVWKRLQAGENLRPPYSSVRLAAGALVWEVLPGSPAEKGGVRPGDVILGPQQSGDWLNVADLGQASVLQVQRLDATFTVSLANEPWRYQAFDWEPLGGGVWYLRIRSFWTSEEDYSELIGLVDDVLTFIQAFRPAAWIVDLRNNAGGFAEAAAVVASRLGFSGVFAEKVDRQGSTSTITAETDWRAGATSAVVVLVNEHTASAAEVFAATLQDSGRGHVIGEPTKGSVRSSKPFEVGGGALGISTHITYAGPNHRSVDKVGVAPDEVVSLDAESLMQAKILGQFRSDYGGQLQSDPMASQYDSQLQAALDYVRALLGR